jgi:hypothetical protein
MAGRRLYAIPLVPSTFRVPPILLQRRKALIVPLGLGYLTETEIVKGCSPTARSNCPTIILYVLFSVRNWKEASASPTPRMDMMTFRPEVTLSDAACPAAVVI